ncbi:hypothetical protein CFC21_024724 [Triticum aestivum]|uniref:Uncharacterized protein n=3 Tax=Triticum TaxID=4564 RepID=A0A9R1PX50_TRITD|nr:uncharacterized protein LOC123041739 [Triticum aestivum]KAF7010301.1 hypothetical protein CFC21_024724 [Triticum aestivum]VAH50198.1 unnamed protein product [Triticum turgidum subsp. durum]
MEAYMLFPRSNGKSCEEEQEEDIGCPSESEVSAAGSMLSSDEELDDEATSSSSSSGSTDNFQMSSLMAQLPLKRGLSKFFDGKSQSFASLAAVGGLEDLAKPPGKRIKTSRSCEVGLQDAHRRRFARHNAAAFKKVSKGRLSALGRAPPLRPLTASAARPKGLPVRAPLFV